MKAALSACVVSLLIASSTRASVLDVLSADPDAPIVELAFRGTMRGKAGVRIPFVRPAADGAGVVFELPLFIDLHNSGALPIIPHHFWRGRLALEGGYQFPVKDWVFTAVLAAEHESDHPTGPGDLSNDPTFSTVWSGYFNVNDLALRLRAQRRALHPTTLELNNTLHLLTCTWDIYRCGAQGGLGGDRGYQVSVLATQQFTLTQQRTWLASLSSQFTFVAPTAQIAREVRLTVRAGAARQIRTTWLALSAMLLIGNEVGVFRNFAPTMTAGISLSWTPFDE